MKQYVKHEDGVVIEYPYSLTKLSSDYPNVSFPIPLTDDAIEQFGISPVEPAPMPSVEALTQKAVEQSPVLQDGVWVQVWEVEPLTDEERAELIAVLQDDIVSATQQRLDDFAKTRNYDSILSLATYATSTNAKFQTEGQYGVEARDTTWAKLYEILAEVEDGTRPMPAGFSDIEPELPTLDWSVKLP